MTRTRWQLLALVVGLLLAQAAWILTVPPFRGIDEFDHAFRAAGVASGDWVLSEPAEDGRGLLTEVPAELVDAARPQCEQLTYTRPDNCRPVAQRAGESVLIATAAGTYNPLYYFVVGAAAAAVEGAWSLYAMRAISALLCLLGLVAAASFLTRQGHNWTRLGFLAGTTPVLIFSTTIVAPNGLEMAAGLSLWCSALAVAEAPERAHARATMVVAGGSACTLALLRPLGPLWVVLILAVVALFVGRTGIAAVWRSRRPGVVAFCAAAVLSVLASGAWSWLAGVGTRGQGADTPPREVTFEPFVSVVLWMLQLVGAFPYRDQAAPAAVYPLVLLVVIVLIWTGVRRAVGLSRLAVLAAVVVSVLVPIAFTVATMEDLGVIWQGRYGLPFVAGVPVLCGRVLDRSGWAPVERLRLISLAVCMLALAQVVSVVQVVRQELDNAVSAADARWVSPGPVGVGMLMAAGWILLLWWARQGQSRPSENADSRS